MSYDPVTERPYIPIIDRRRTPAPSPDALPMAGRLLAWDPKKQAARWSVEHPLIINSGVLSTAGNLVFHGQGTGAFAADAADTRQKLWSGHSGLGRHSPPPD